jgi:hypothetical protein
MTLTEERQLLKAFHRRRAGLEPPDEVADKALLALLRAVERTQSGAWLPLRPLTDQERKDFSAGTIRLQGEILTQGAAQAAEAERHAKVRAIATAAARKATTEAARLQAEAQRLRESAP